MKKRKIWPILIIVLLAAVGGGYIAYTNLSAPAVEATEEPQVQTTTVSRGDLLITADGTGTLTPAQEVKVGFATGGVLSEAPVKVGDQAQAGDVLARLDDTDARQAVAEAELQVAQAEATLSQQQDTTAAEQAIALNEIQVSQAEASLASAQLKLDDLLTWTPDENAVELAQANLDAAQADYARIAARAEHTDDQLASARVNLEKAQATLSDAQAAYDTAWDPGRDWELGDPQRVTKLENERAATQRNLERAQLDLEVAQANYNLAVLEIDDSNLQNAWAKVVSAQKNLEDAQTGPDENEIETARIQVQQAELSLAQTQLNLEAAQVKIEDWDTTPAELALAQAQLKLETAQRNLAETILLAPVSGTVMAVQAQVGESVSAGPIITLADLEEPQVLFWVEESDLMSVAPGNSVNIVFEALPDYIFPGEIVSVDPALVKVDGTPAVQSWASVDLSAHPVSLLSGMNADVEIVAGEALNALLVPVQALRELGPDQYAVFVVGANGELELRPVEVGLQDFVNVEIISGLKAGEVVSVGTATSSATSTESSTDSEQPPPGIMRFLGGG